MDEEIDIESQPFTNETGTNYAASSDSGSKMPPLNLARAQHILNKFTEDPSWLANPRTAHAANAVFSAASKIVGMGIQMDRVENMGMAVKNRNEFTKQKVNALGKVSAFVPESDEVGQSELGRLNGMASSINSPDFNLSEFANGVSRLQSKYKAPLETAGKIDYDRQALINSGATPERIAAFDKSLESKRNSTGHLLIRDQEDYLAKLKADPNSDPEVVDRVESRIKYLSRGDLERQDAASWLMDERERHAISLMDEREKHKYRQTLNTQINKAEADAVAVLKDSTLSAKLGSPEALQERAKSYRRKLGVLENSKPSSTNSPSKAPASTASPYKEGTRLKGPDGRFYIVKDGQPELE